MTKQRPHTRRSKRGRKFRAGRGKRKIKKIRRVFERSAYLDIEDLDPRIERLENISMTLKGPGGEMYAKELRRLKRMKELTTKKG